MDHAVSENGVVDMKLYSLKIHPVSNSLLFLSDDKGMLALRKTTDYGQTFKTIATRVYSFILGGKFLIASIMTGKVRLHQDHSFNDLHNCTCIY